MDAPCNTLAIPTRKQDRRLSCALQATCSGGFDQSSNSLQHHHDSCFNATIPTIPASRGPTQIREHLVRAMKSGFGFRPTENETSDGHRFRS